MNRCYYEFMIFRLELAIHNIGASTTICCNVIFFLFKDRGLTKSSSKDQSYTGTMPEEEIEALSIIQRNSRHSSYLSQLLCVCHFFLFSGLYYGIGLSVRWQIKFTHLDKCVKLDLERPILNIIYTQPLQ